MSFAPIHLWSYGCWEQTEVVTINVASQLTVVLLLYPDRKMERGGELFKYWDLSVFVSLSTGQQQLWQ